MGLYSVLLSLHVVSSALALQSAGELGKLPALGWNSWNAFDTDINETKIIVAAQKLISLGLKVPCHVVALLSWARLTADRMRDTSM